MTPFAFTNRASQLSWWRTALVGAMILTGFVAATNRWLDWGAGLRLVQANDERDYRAMAAAVPHLPGVRLQNQHAQRFACEYVIGLLGRLLGGNLDAAYAVGTALVMLALLATLIGLLKRIGCSRRALILCLAVFILNAYSLRYYLIARGEITDLLFDLGVLLSMTGLFARRYPLVIAGTIIAALARQTEVPAALAVGVCVYVWPGPDRLPGRATRLVRALVPPLIAVALYLIEVRVSQSFSYDTTPRFGRFTVLDELAALPSGAGMLAQHVLRSVNGLLAVGVLIVVAAAAVSGSRRGHGLPAEFWASVGIGAAIALQPLALSARYAEHNETRLSVLALGALVCALAVLLAELERTGHRLSPAATAGLLAVLALDSFHHLYTVVGTTDASQTLVLQVLSAVGAGVILGSAVRRPTLRGRPPEVADPPGREMLVR